MPEDKVKRYTIKLAADKFVVIDTHQNQGVSVHQTWRGAVAKAESLNFQEANNA